MESPFSGIPKFKSPEEELQFLREHVKRQESELLSNNQEADREEITREAVLDYSETKQEDVLHDTHKMSKKETEAIVLRLQPETHDSQMEELLAILLNKGIRNAIEVVDKMNNPHIDDDFHRFLVQYIHSVDKVPNLKEKTPLWKSLHMKLFEITLPSPNTSSEEKKGFKDFIGAMEQFYSGMLSVRSDEQNHERNYYTLEIALSSSSDEVVIYAAIPESRIDLFEKQVLAFYDHAKVREVLDDYNVFNVNGVAVGAYARQAKKPVLPIKLYEEIDHDPMNPILNAFSKLQKVGEGASIQFIIAPVGDEHIRTYHRILDEVKDGKPIRMGFRLFGEFNEEVRSVARDLIHGRDDDKKEEKKVNDRSVEAITNKVKSTLLASTIRIVASAETKQRAEAILLDLESAFNQFADTNSNRILFSKVTSGGMKRFFHEYSYRFLKQNEQMMLNIKELATLFHFPVGVGSSPQLKEAKSGIAPAPMEMQSEGILLGVNEYRGKETEIHFMPEDRLRHFYMIGQTGVGKTTLFLNMIIQDIKNGEGVCYIDPHGTDINTILANIPPERIDDVIYFDPAYTPRPMGLNMLEYDPNYPEQKTFVVNELMGIFNKLFDMKTGGGAMFEQYFRNSAFLVMEDPDSGSTLLEITRVLADSEFRKMKLAKCKNPIIKQFWESAEQTTGDQSLANFVPYISSKFDNFISNDIMRPVVLQQKSVFNFRKIMDEKKILLVNLSKGRLGEINANLIGLVLVGKLQMAALSRVDMFGKDFAPFYMYIDEFQNVTTDSISSILSEARKYRLSLNITHQYLAQLEEPIKNAVFGNVGSMAAFRISSEDAKFIEPRFAPIFTAEDMMKIDNRNAYVSMLVKGQPTKPFNMRTLAPKEGNSAHLEKMKELSYLKFGRPREEVESEILERFSSSK
jgi:hypothetical protein